MTIPCPICGRNMRLKYRRANAAGSISSRHDCPGCGHRQIDRDAHHESRSRRFDDATVRAIRSARTSLTEEARIRGCSKELIRQIRNGLAYRDSWDAGMAVGSVSCVKCVHWQQEQTELEYVNDRRRVHVIEAAHCGLGFPDPTEEGPGFARQCSVYREVKP
jgi:Zn ribbon nucleic-acid-binding protein